MKAQGQGVLARCVLTRERWDGSILQFGWHHSLQLVTGMDCHHHRLIGHGLEEGSLIGGDILKAKYRLLVHRGVPLLGASTGVGGVGEGVGVEKPKLPHVNVCLCRSEYVAEGLGGFQPGTAW